MARTLDPKRHTNSALTTELCRNIISKGCFDGYDKTEGKHFEKKYLLNPEKWTLPKVNTQRSQMIYTFNCYRLIILSYDTYITVVFQRSILNLLTQLLKMKQGVNVAALQQKMKLHGSQANSKPRGSKPKAKIDASDIVFNV